MANRDVMLVLNGCEWDRPSTVMMWSKPDAEPYRVFEWVDAVLQISYANVLRLVWRGNDLVWTPKRHEVDSKAVSFQKWRFPLIVNDQLVSVKIPFANWWMPAGPKWETPWPEILDAFEALCGTRPATPSPSVESKRLTKPVIYQVTH